MNELVTQLQNDSTLMLMMIIAVVVLLVIVLVILVSAMRVKSYKEKFWYVQNDAKEKAEKIATLENELQALNIEHANLSQKLEQFEETKSKLSSTSEQLLVSQADMHTLEKLQGQTQTKFENITQKCDALKKEYEALQEKHEHAMEENSKFRTNNARLLMKLESEERYTISQKETLKSYKKEMQSMFMSIVKKIDNEEAKKVLKEMEDKFKIL